MQFVFNLLASLAGFYSLLILIRIIMSWFTGGSPDSLSSKPVVLLRSITDPYLDFWRRNLNLRLGVFDLSPIAGIVSLSILQTILHSLARFNKITIGTILAVILSALWSVAGFLLGFCFVIFILRIIMYMTNRDIYSPFWKAIDSVSQPVSYSINRIIFGNKIVNYVKGLVVSSLVLLALRIAGGILVPILARLLAGLPV